MQNNSVNKGTFHSLGARIWVPMPVYQYENPSGYVTEHAHGKDTSLHFETTFYSGWSLSQQQVKHSHEWPYNAQQVEPLGNTTLNTFQKKDQVTAPNMNSIFLPFYLWLHSFQYSTS